jgi:hypothetical protein
MEHTPPFCKDGHFHFHCPVIFTFHLCCYFKLRSDAINITPSQPSTRTPQCRHSLPPSTHYHHRNFVTTHRHHSHAHYHACRSREWPQTTRFGCNASPNDGCRRLGSRICFSSFVSCFYKLTNRNFPFLGSILPVTTAADVAQPMPTPACTTPPPRPNGM